MLPQKTLLMFLSKTFLMESPGRLFQVQVSFSENPQAGLRDSHTLHLDQCEDGKEIAVDVFDKEKHNHDIDAFKNYGKKLFDHLFKKDTLARELLESILPPHPVGRILLDFNHNIELDNIPWEYMRIADDYLIQRCMLTRTQKRPETHLQELPLRILCVTPDPVDSHNLGLKDLHLSDQVQTVINKINDRQVMFERVFPPTVDKMESLLTHRPDTATVLHFMGHCIKNTSTRALVFEDEAGKGNVVDTKRLLSHHKNLRLAYLSSCQTREVAREMTNHGVPYAIGSLSSLPDDIARIFEAKFYKYLADGYFIEEAMWKTRVALLEYSHCRQRDYLPGAMVLYSGTSQMNHGQFSCELGKPVVKLHMPPNNLDTITITKKFLGRKKEMIDLCNHFLRMATRGSQTGNVYTIVGINGQGKTTLAIKLAYRVAHAFPGGIFSWQFDDKAISTADYLWRLADVLFSKVELDKLKQNNNNNDVRNLGEDICREFSGKASRLLILDHADALKRAVDRGDNEAIALKNWLLSAISIPGSAVNILVTSHEPLDWLPGKPTMQLQGFEGEDSKSGARLFYDNLTEDACKRMKTEPRQLWEELVRVVHGHPLSLIRLGRTASLSEHRHKSLEDIVRRDHRTLLAMDNSRYKSLHNCFNAMICSLRPQLYLLLHICSLFSRVIKSEDIMVASQVVEYTTQSTAKLLVSDTELKNNLQELCELGLLLNSGSNEYRAHVSVCEAARQLSNLFKSPKYCDPNDRETLLHKIAARGYVKGVKLLITEFELDANAKDNNDVTPLHLAAERGHLDVVKLLVTEFEAKTYVKNFNGMSPLHMAAKEGHVKVAEWLVVESAASVEAKHNITRTPDHLATPGYSLRADDTPTISKKNVKRKSFPWSAKKAYEVMKFFLTAFGAIKMEKLARDNEDNDSRLLLTTDDTIESAKGAIEFILDVNVGDSDGRTPLYQAVEHGHTEMVKLLVDKLGANTNSKANDGQTPLHRAADHGHVEVVKLLLHDDLNTDANARAKDGQTPLHRAVRSGHVVVIKLLAGKADAYSNAKDDNGCTLLHHAAEKGYIEIVRLLVTDLKMDANVKDNNGLTPLHYAAKNGHMNVVKLLAGDLDADVSIKANNGWTPLHQAACNGHAEIVRLLVEQFKVDPNPKSNNDRTPIYLATSGGHVEVMKQLGIDVKAKDKDGSTLLHWAVENGNIEVVRLLLKEYGANSNAKSNDGKTPLHLAADSGHFEIVKLLTSQLGADADTKANNGRTPLHQAALNGHVEIVRILATKFERDLNTKDNEESTPAHLAAIGGHLEVMMQLVSQFGTNVNTTDSNGWTLLHWAAAKGYMEMVKLLTELGADTNAKSNDGKTPLHLAAARGHIEVTKQLCTDFNAKDNDGCALLHWAVGNGFAEIVRLLLGEDGANPDAKSDDGQTPLHRAVDCGQIEMVKLLVSKLGANVNSRAKDEQTPLHRAARGGHIEIVRLLATELGADVNAKDTKGQTPVHSATLGGHIEVLKQLCKDVGVMDNEGRTLLHLAAEKGYTEVVKLLVAKFGADINAKSKDGETPLHRAVLNGHVEIVNLLHELGAAMNVEDNEGLTPCRRAVRQGNPKMVELLESFVAKPNNEKGSSTTIDNATSMVEIHNTPPVCNVILEEVPKPVSDPNLHSMTTKNIDNSTTVGPNIMQKSPSRVDKTLGRSSVLTKSIQKSESTVKKSESAVEKPKPKHTTVDPQKSSSGLVDRSRGRSSATTDKVFKNTEHPVKETEKSESAVEKPKPKHTTVDPNLTQKSSSGLVDRSRRRRSATTDKVFKNIERPVKETEKSEPIVTKFDQTPARSEKPKSPPASKHKQWKP